MKKSKELLGLYCPVAGCGYWEQPPVVSIDYEIMCPLHCKVELESRMGHYEIEPAKWTWHGRVKAKYVNFVPIEKISPVLGDIETIDSGEPLHKLPEIGNLEIFEDKEKVEINPVEAVLAEVCGKRLNEMLTQFAGEELDKSMAKDNPVDKVGVHETHCCVVHGCKYGDRNCPVVLGEIKQQYICEECDLAEGWTSLLDVFTKVKEQQNGMLPYISHENYEKLYSEEIGLAVMGNYVDDHAYEFEHGLTREEQACFEKYRLITSPTVMDSLHFIEGMKTIYDIHYCKAGIGIIFYYAKNDVGDYRSGLSVDRYHDSFEECIKVEARKIYDARMSWLG